MSISVREVSGMSIHERLLCLVGNLRAKSCRVIKVDVKVDVGSTGSWFCGVDSTLVLTEP